MVFQGKGLMTTQDNQDGHTTTHHPQEHILDNGTIQSKNRLLILHLKGEGPGPLGRRFSDTQPPEESERTTTCDNLQQH